MPFFPNTSGGGIVTIPTIDIGTSGTTSIPSGVKIVTNTGGAGGITTGQTTLDKILSTFLSTYALSKNAPYVPTTAQPVQQGYGYGGGLDPQTLAILQAGQYGGGSGTALGKVEVWLKQNTGVALIAAAIGVAYLMKSPRR